MDIITRGDWDGLVSSVLLTEVEEIKRIKFVHPKDIQDGLIKADEKDIVVNVPHVEGCGLWFDHHISEEDGLTDVGNFKGRFEIAPSCARVIYNHYVEISGKNAKKLEPHMALLEAADKLDSAKLSMDDVLEPEGWILLGLTIDPRSGLGPEFRQYFRWLVEYVKELPMEKVMQHREVRLRCDRVKGEHDEYRKVLERHAWVEGNVVVVDLRGLFPKPVGPRFLVFAMFPEVDVEVRIFEGLEGVVVIAVGHSIFKRTCKVDVGHLMKEYGGGGHRGAGSTQISATDPEQTIQEIVNRLKT
jgi:hypothetical protein